MGESPRAYQDAPLPGRAAAALALLLGPGLAATAFLAARRHPDLFERLAEIPNPTFALVPDELPVAFVLRADARRPMLRAVPKGALGQAKAASESSCECTPDGVTRRYMDGGGGSPAAAATIRGPLRLLAALADGRLDGDALFFSREIAIEGSTEAAVALRNALDNAELGGLAELVLPPGPAAALAQRLLRLGGKALEKLHAGLKS